MRQSFFIAVISLTCQLAILQFRNDVHRFLRAEPDREPAPRSTNHVSIVDVESDETQPQVEDLRDDSLRTHDVPPTGTISH